MLRIAAVIAGMLLLSGCVTSPRPAGLSGDEQQNFAVMMQKQQWRYSDIGDRERPVVTPIEVDPTEVAQRIYECLVDAGLGDGFSLDENGLTGSVTLETPDDRTAFYVCQVSFIPPARYWGYLSIDELNATYDYFQDWLVPCLESHDYHPPNAPPREYFAAQPGYLSWDPYSALGARITNEAMAELQEECPDVPTWLYG
jgi:hypothetical protein